jgi:hypothetical protein
VKITRVEAILPCLPRAGIRIVEQGHATPERTGGERPGCQRKIDAMDRETVRLECELYGLTEEKIRIVEENA